MNPWINSFPQDPTFWCSPIWTVPYQGPRLQYMFLRWAHSIAWSLSEKQLMKRLPLPSTQGQWELGCLWFISKDMARVSLPLFFTGMFSVWLLRSGLQGRRGVCWPCTLSKVSVSVSMLAPWMWPHSHPWRLCLLNKVSYFLLHLPFIVGAECWHLPPCQVSSLIRSCLSICYHATYICAA